MPEVGYSITLRCAYCEFGKRLTNLSTEKDLKTAFNGVKIHMSKAHPGMVKRFRGRLQINKKANKVIPVPEQAV